MNITCAILNSPGLGKTLGKKGTESDMTLYNRKQGADVFSFVEPTRYPEKIAPLCQALAMADCAILTLSGLTPEAGEQIVALDAFGVEKGLLILKGVIYEQAAPIIKGTVVEGYSQVNEDFNAITEALKAMEPNWDSSGPLKVPLDHFFKSKTIGTVALGLVERGTLKVHESLEVAPLGRDVSVKSVQMQDENVQEAPPGSRVGVALKGIESEELSRGCVLAKKGTALWKDSFDINLHVTRFFKEGVKKGQSYSLSLGMYFGTVTVEDAGGDAIGPGKKGTIRIRSEHPVPYETGDRAVLLSPGVKGLRIAGHGAIG